MDNKLLIINSYSENKPVTINLVNTQKAAMIYRAINHQLRQRMLRLIDMRGAMKVSDIYKTLKMEQSEASRHLGCLRMAGVVKTERKAKCIYYSLNTDRLKEINEMAALLTGQNQ